VTFAAQSISCVSKIGGMLNRNVGTRLTGTGRNAVCPEGTPCVAAGMAGSGYTNTQIKQNWHRDN